MSTLYPTFDDTELVYGDRVMSRPFPIGGCITLIKYERLTSNRLPEYGPFDRFVDRAKLASSLTLDDVYGPDRYATAYKISIMGSALKPRPAFLDQVYPSKGMTCAGAPDSP